MPTKAKVKTEQAAAILAKSDPASPALKLVDTNAIAIKAGTVFAGEKFLKDTPVPMITMTKGTDYVVILTPDGPRLMRLSSADLPDSCLGGFHFAPGGNAPARSGGDSTPTINPQTLWDLSFRFAGADQRGMTFVERGNSRYWGDIYPLAKDHMAGGTSQFGVTIADGDDPPQNPKGGYFDGLDYATAVAVMAHHGKTLLSTDEFSDGAYGVTERTAFGRDPKLTGLDAPRTSWCGWMMATGGMWVWCHDGDPDVPRASIAGGSWLHDGHAGSQFADVDYWPGYSSGTLGARGRGEHLQPV